MTSEKVEFFLSMEKALTAVGEVFTLYGLDVQLGKLHSSFKVPFFCVLLYSTYPK